MRRPNPDMLELLAREPETVYLGEKYAVAVPMSDAQRKRFKGVCQRLNKTMEEMANRSVVECSPRSSTNARTHTTRSPLSSSASTCT